MLKSNIDHSNRIVTLLLEFTVLGFRYQVNFSSVTPESVHVHPFTSNIMLS